MRNFEKSHCLSYLLVFYCLLMITEHVFINLNSQSAILRCFEKVIIGVVGIASAQILKQGTRSEAHESGRERTEADSFVFCLDHWQNYIFMFYVYFCLRSLQNYTFMFYVYFCLRSLQNYTFMFCVYLCLRSLAKLYIYVLCVFLP